MDKLFNSLKQSLENSHRQHQQQHQQQQQPQQHQQPQQSQQHHSNGPITFTNVYNGLNVTSRATIVHGYARCGKDGEIGTQYHGNSFPSQRWPMVKGHFTATVFLEQGENRILFETLDNSGDSAELVLKYAPIDSDPPVHFVLLLGSDSNGTVDAPPYKMQSEGNSLELSVRKLRLAAYLMSAFTQEQMARNLFGFRTFRPYEQDEKCTLSDRDQRPSRRTVHVHVVRCSKTVAEIRDANRAQQNPQATDAGALFSIAADALRDHGAPFSLENFTQAACIFIDTHWDPSIKLVRGHAALGGCANQLRLAIFGSHAMHTWPASVEQITSAFSDSTVNDLNCVANDAETGGCAWEALNVSMGAFMHEVGHSLGCPHEPSGVMLRGYLEWNRSFLVRDAFSPRLNKVPCPLVQKQDENYWHRLDVLRFRWHKAFALPGEPELKGDGKPVFLPFDDGVYVQSSSEGIYMVDVQTDDMSKTHYEFPTLQQGVRISLHDVMQRLSVDDRNKPIKLEAHCPAMANASINDFRSFATPRGPNGLWQSSTGGQENGDQMTVVFPRAMQLQSVIVHAGDSFDGYTFVSTDGQRMVLGHGGGDQTEFKLAPGDELAGISVRCGLWCDAGGIVTRGGPSQLFGGNGGGLCTFTVPPGYRVAGVTGWFQQWCQGVALLYERA